ncbi:hypothetical protein [Taibaiella helva]|uniref:hypothetical protein n=1 Tax=Taibaiella helva TaxID=2301235 RepID=UPI000E5676B6|nr:hypothetical protein [Taibaiella helva]
MKPYLKHYLLILHLAAIPTAAFSQRGLGATEADAKMLPGGAGSGGGMSGIYSPNLFDGTANINIPIFQYSTEGADYGIGLSYNTLGVKLDELASVAGMHWTLRAEGSISRTVKDLPDELAMTIDTIYTSNTQYYTRVKGRLAQDMETAQQASDPNVYRDHESDEFVLSAGGLSLSFRLGRNGQVFTHPHRNVKIQLLSNGQPLPATGSGSVPPAALSLEFVVTDEQGNRYYFTKGDYRVWEMLTLSAQPLGTGMEVAGPDEIGRFDQVDRWVVSRIELAGGSALRYQYRSSERADATYMAVEKKTPSASISYGEVPGSGYKALISRIEYPNGVSADFVYDDQHQRCDNGREANGTGAPTPALTEIKVGAATGGSCLRYRLNQSYIVTDTFNQVTEKPLGSPCNTITGLYPYRTHRLRLNSITLLSCDGLSSEPYYSFAYDPTPMAPRFRAGQDYFGYANGRRATGWGLEPSGDLSIPYHLNASNANGDFYYGVDRTADFSYGRAGILTKVTNAYGGYVEFGYAPHNTLANTFNPQPANLNNFLGREANDGLCLASIKESDPYHAGNYRLTSFSYEEGQQFLSGGYFSGPVTYSHYQSGPTAVGNWTNTYLTAHHLVGNSNHGYSKVTVTQTDNNGAQLSRKVTRFTNIVDVNDNGQPINRYQVVGGGKPFYAFPYNDKQYLRDWEIGLPLLVQEYDNLNNLVQETRYRYRFTLDSTSALTAGVGGTKYSYVHGQLLSIPNVSAHPIIEQIAVTDPYVPYTGKSLLQSTIIRKYMSYGGQVYDSMAYTYDSRENLKTIVTRNSEGEEVQTIHYYNYDAGAYDPLPGLERQVTTQRWKRIAGTTGPLPDNGVLLDAYFTGLAADGSSGSYSRIRNKTLYNLQTAGQLSYSSYLGTGPLNSTPLKINAVTQGAALPDFRKTSEVLQADAKGNPLETYLPDGEQYKAMVWDTATGKKLAEAVGCRYADMAYTSFEAGPYTTNFTYDPRTVPGGVTGTVCFSLWNSQTLQPNPITGTRDLQPGKEYLLSFWLKGPNPGITLGGAGLALPASPAVTKGDWKQYIIRFTPGAASRISIYGSANGTYLDEVRLHPASALMQSWSADALLGTTSAADARGRITYYEYDAMGRPYLVRDQEGHILSKTQYTLHGAE